MSALPASGILLADKPAGITSHDVVARARRALGVRRIGHAGTLDPFATGLLIVLVARATRLQRFFMALPKTGVLPDEPLRLPLGVIRQRPPAYSAVKLGGERAYARARRGESVELAEREVEVYECRELAREGDRVSLRISCSSGTYVRSIVAARGDAYCLELRRTAIGPFGVEGAWPTQGPASLIDIVSACARFLPVFELDDEQARAVRHGRAIAAPAGESPVLMVDANGAIAIAERRQSAELGTLLAPIVGLAGQ